MSTRIMSDCWGLQMPPTAKSVLISLADNANDSGFCWPSIQHICARTCLGKNTVIFAIKWLEKSGILFSNRDNGRHTTYVIKPSSFDEKFSEPIRGESPNTTKNRTSEYKDNVINQCRSGTSLGEEPVPQRYQPVPQRHQPVPQRDTNRKEPSRTVIVGLARARKKDDVVMPEWIDKSTWDKFIEHRRLLKKPMSEYAKKLTFDKLDKLRKKGHDPSVIMENSILNGWIGIFEPRAEISKAGKAGGGFESKQEALEKRNAAVVRRWLSNAKTRGIDSEVEILEGGE